MLNVQYAASTSPGLMAGQIGWINFGPDLLLNPSICPIVISNCIPGGYCITFQLSASVVTTPVSTDIPSIIANTSPAFSNMPFGAVYYKGIGGYPSLVMQSNTNTTSNISYTININNICVTDMYGNQVSNYTIYAADAEETNTGTDESSETWQVTTDGGMWQLLETIPSYNGTMTGPTVTGIDTFTVLETGTDTLPNNTNSNVFSTVRPKNLTALFSTFGGNQGFAFGITITPPQKEILFSGCKCQNINYFYSTMPQVYNMPCDMTISTITFSGVEYNVGTTPVTVEGNLASYSITQNTITVTPYQEPATVSYWNLIKPIDVFEAIIEKVSCNVCNYIMFNAQILFCSCFNLT